MSVSVTMPQLGESVTEGTVTRWLKQVGDTVTADEPLLEISTDKVDTEIPAPASGVLLEIRALEDAVVQVGAELAVIGAANESAAPAAPQAPAAPEPVAAVVETPAAVEAAAPAQNAVPAATGESVDVILPQLGESVTEGTVTRWLKQVGDTVAADEALVEISTDKVDTEIPAPAAGVLLSIAVNEDVTAAVGTVLGVIGTGASAPAAPVTPAPAAPVAPTPAPAAPVVAAPAAPAAPAPPPVLSAPKGGDDDSYVTPLVRRLAAQKGVDLSTIVGTGVGGRIRKQDVLAAAEGTVAAPATPAAAPVVAAPVAAPVSTAPVSAAPAAPATPVAVSPLRGRTEPISRLRKVIAERMVESLQVSAQLTSVVEVDVTRIANLRNKVKGNFESREGVKLTFLPFIAKSALESLKSFPMVNASIDMAAGTITYHDTENLGIAVDTDRGLLVPVIRNAGDLNLAGLSRSINDIAERTRSSKVAPDELSGGTFTITNTGSRGSLFDTPIINQPQVAILGTGAIEKRPVVVPDSTGQDVIAIRSMMYLALSYDHRLVDGADAARFLVAIKNRLEEGAFESELGL